MVSVIIPSYNRAKTLPLSMDSVLAQTEGDLELIVVDDGSTDDTQAVVEGYADPRVRYVKLAQNGGACRARNRGILEARGEYIAFQDSDDKWLPQKLERQLAFLKAQGADMCYHALESFYEDGSREGIIPAQKPVNTFDKLATAKDLLDNGKVVTQCILVRAACAKEVLFDEQMPRYQEWEWSVRFAQRYTCCYLDEVLVHRYLQKDSISRVSKNLPVAITRIFYQNFALIRSDKSLWKKWTQEVANRRFNQGLPARKECGYAFAATLHPKYLVKYLLCCLGLEKKLGKDIHAN